MTPTEAIAALKDKRLMIVTRWRHLRPWVPGYWRETDRMMRLTSAIDHALVRLGAEV